MCRRSPHRLPAGRRGYTLGEVTVVMAISVVAASVAAPRYAAAVRNFRVSQAANRVAADLALAQWTGKSTSATGLAVAFDVAGSTYTLPGVAGPTGPGSAYTVSLAAAPYQATLVSASFGSSATVTFDRYGQPSSGGTVVVQVGVAQKTVTVDANSGKATIQ